MSTMEQIQELDSSYVRSSEDWPPRCRHFTIIAKNYKETTSHYFMRGVANMRYGIAAEREDPKSGKCDMIAHVTFRKPHSTSKKSIASLFPPGWIVRPCKGGNPKESIERCLRGKRIYETGLPLGQGSSKCIGHAW